MEPDISVFTEFRGTKTFERIVVNRYYLLRYINARFYEGDGDGSGNSPPPPPPSPPVVPPPPPSGVFNQQQVNKLLADERRKHADKLKELQSESGLSKARVEELQSQIAELETGYMSKAEIAERDFASKQKQYEKDLKTQQEQASYWQTQHNGLLVNYSITEAAASADVFNMQQIHNLLGGKSKVVPIIKDGKEAGLEVRVSFPDVDSEGKPVVLSLTPAEALKRMKELPQDYGNLFKSGVTGGVGGSNNGTGGGTAPSLEEAAKISPEAYRKARDASKKK